MPPIVNPIPNSFAPSAFRPLRPSGVARGLLYLGIAGYLFVSGLLFFTWVNPSLIGQTGDHIAADSDTYMSFARSLKAGENDPFVLASLSSFPNTLWGPVLLGLALNSTIAIVAFDYALIIFSLWLILRSAPVNVALLLFLIFGNVTTFISLLSLNKEILDLLVTSLFIYYLAHGKRLALVAALLIATVCRYETSVVMLVYLGLESRWNFLRHFRKTMLVLVTVALSVLLAGLFSEAMQFRLQEANATASGGGLLLLLDSLQTHYLFFVAVIPKILDNLFSELINISHWSTYSLHDPANSFFLLANNLANFGVLAYLLWIRRFTLRSNLVYYACLSAIFMSTALVIQPRYFFGAYIMLCVEAARRRPAPMALPAGEKRPPLPEPQAGASPSFPVSILAVIVLYKTLPAQSSSYLTLLAAAEAAAATTHLRLQVLLYDNTPGPEGPIALPDFVRYLASEVNTGLANAYNFALHEAASEGFSWVLTLDQDTTLPTTFFEQLVPIALSAEPNTSIGAIVPHISTGSRTVSPNWFVGHVHPRWFEAGFYGVPGKAVFALNSGALLRVSALQQLGGYSPLFWLDGSDLYMFRKLEKAGKKVLVAGTISIEHNLSITDIRSGMSLPRYHNALAAGSAFFDLEYGRAVGLGHTLQLLYVYLRQVLGRQEPAIRNLTRTMIGHRLFWSRARRLSGWLAEQEARSAQYKATPKLDPRIASLFAVVVLHQMTPQNSPAVQTLNLAAAQVSSDALCFKTLIYDNTPLAGTSPPPELGAIYFPAVRNVGLSKAYNDATELAEAEGYDWLLTLDQDTHLPADFLEKVAAILQQVDADNRIAAVLPLLIEGGRVLSPHWFKLDFFPRAFSKANHGIQSGSVYGFNSGAVLRTRALKNIGGYNPLFWLDYSDAYVFRMLHRAGYKGFVAGQVVLEHHLSLLGTQPMSDLRYRNLIQAGSAFCDLYRNWLVGLQFTYRLFRSYLGQLRGKGDKGKRQILREALRNRLAVSRKKRIANWIQREAERQEA